MVQNPEPSVMKTYIAEGRAAAFRVRVHPEPPTRPPRILSPFTVVAPPSSVVKCLWEVVVWGFGALFLSCACVSVSVGGVVLCRCVCVCDLLIFLPFRRYSGWCKTRNLP